MKPRNTYLFLLVLLVVAACTSGDRMRRDLAALEARNQSDSLLTDSTLALSLADYFTTHGTQAERLEAHYLLARTWADLGQAPRALDAFHTAAEQADTTRLDCDYRLLDRVYSQMANLFYMQSMPNEMLEALELMEGAAEKAQDTLSQIAAIELRYLAYDMLGNRDMAKHSVISAYDAYMANGYEDMAENCLPAVIDCLVEEGNYQQAAHYISLFESNSSCYADGEVHPGQEIYYHIKGNYCIAIGQHDLAEECFRKELSKANDANDKEAAYKGLCELYRKQGLTDSIAKYAYLCYQASNLQFRESCASELMHMHHLYDYSRFQTLADRKTIEASHANQRAVLLAIVIAVLISLFFFVRKQAVKKLKKVNTDYVNTLILYNKVKDELQSQQNNNAKELQQAESELQRLKEQLATAQQDKHTPDKWDMNSELLNSYIYLEFHQAAAKGKTMPTEKWEQLRRMVNAKMPRFMEAISTLDYSPDLFETQLIILIKLRFLISEIAVLLDVPTYTLTKRRKRLLKLMFKTDGTADEFDRRISVLGIDETDAF